jgi:hypothetical protein
MRITKIVLGLASMAMLLVVSAAPAMADDFHRDHFFNHHDHFFNDNGIFQSNEQEVESGDSTQTFNVVGGGDNSNACQNVQGISNTGNAVQNTGVLQADPFNNDFNNGFFFDPFFDNGFFDRGGQVDIDDVGNFEISPSSSTSCSQQVNQAASASG